VQTVSLIAAAVELEGIATVCLSLLREVTSVTRPPRALFVPFLLGFPLGAPHDVVLQTRVIEQALALLPRRDVPVFEDFR